MLILIRSLYDYMIMTTPWLWQRAPIVDYNTYKLTEVNLLNPPCCPLLFRPLSHRMKATTGRVKTLMCNKSNKVDEDAIRLDLGLGIVCRCLLGL